MDLVISKKITSGFKLNTKSRKIFLNLGISYMTGEEKNNNCNNIGIA